MLNARISSAIALALLISASTPSFANNTSTEPDCECPRVTGVTVTSTVTSITVSWNASSIYSSYMVQIGKSGSVGFYFQATSTGNSVTINGTSPSTNYFVRVTGICGDAQAVPSTDVPHITAAGTPSCGGGAADIGGDPLHPVLILTQGQSFLDQIDFEGDADSYYFTVTCPGSVTVTLSSMSNDYDMSVSVGPKTGQGLFFSSSNPGTTNEVVNFSITEGMVPAVVNINVAGFLHAYNTYDCYSISAVGPLPCFHGGGGGENMGTTGGTSLVKNGNVILTLDTPFEKDETVQVQIFATDGRMISGESMQVFKGEPHVNIDFPSVSNGVYLINLSGSFGVKTQKVVVSE